ncbi:MAG TPA: hypothetical protein VGI23_13015, partial [Steroidobacteraceae bacterium]
MIFERPLIYLLPAFAGITAACASVVAYSWSSTLINLACSIQDDSFYYLIPGWNAAHGHGFTFGGETTSGWQPLYELLLTLLSLACNSVESLLRLAINLNGWLFALTAAVAGIALRPLITAATPGLRQSAVALSLCVAVLSFLCLHTAFFSSLTGKENALAALLLASLIWRVLAPGRGIGKPLGVGLLCALLLLTRIAPTSITYASIAILLLHGRRQKLIALSVGLVPLVAWGVFAQQYFGHVLPMSMLVKMNSPKHVSALASARIGLEYFWESTKYSLSAASRFNVLQLQARAGLRDTFQTGLMGAALAVSMLGLLKSERAGATSRAVVALAAFDVAGVAGNVLLGVALAGKSDDIYYTVWYVYDLPVLVAINCGFAIAWIQAQLSATRFNRATTTVLALACVTYFVGDIAWYVRLRPYDASDDAKFAGTSQIKKFEAASWFLANVAPTNPDYKVAAYSA